MLVSRDVFAVGSVVIKLRRRCLVTGHTSLRKEWLLKRLLKLPRRFSIPELVYDMDVIRFKFDRSVELTAPDVPLPDGSARSIPLSLVPYREGDSSSGTRHPAGALCSKIEARVAERGHPVTSRASGR